MLPALLLTAGLGTRLRPLSSVRAKPAVPVAGEPLVCRILRWLASQEVRDAVLNLHHLPETICAAVGDGTGLGLRVRYSWENPVLGSAGGPRRALPLVSSGRFLIVNGDTLTDLPLSGLIARHDGWGALVTLAVVPNAEPDRYGGVLVGGDGVVTGFVGRGSRTPSWHFIGVQVAESRAFAALADGEPAESFTGCYPALMREAPGSVRAVAVDAAFADIGTPADYLSTSLALAGAAAARPVVAGSPRAGARLQASRSARIERSVLWDDVTVGEDARLSECIVADGVGIPAGVRWTRRAIVPAGCGPAAPGDERIGDLLLAPIDRVTPS
jgi:NDP-sugar pyrophosphorylase family protein